MKILQMTDETYDQVWAILNNEHLAIIGDIEDPRNESTSDDYKTLRDHNTLMSNFWTSEMVPVTDKAK